MDGLANMLAGASLPKESPHGISTEGGCNVRQPWSPFVAVCCDDNKCIFVNSTHPTRLASPVGLVVLHNTKGVNPKVAD